jgi:glycosyltransferase involved in cell wall biosynthesis
LKLVILYSGLSGYSAACQRALKEKGVELMVFHWPKAGNAPFDDEIVSHIDHLYDKSEFSNGQILQKIRSFGAEVILMSGWMDKDYLEMAKTLKREGKTIIAGSDTQYKGNLRQLVGKLIAPWYLKKAINKLWVTGDRQYRLARFLGYNKNQILKGFYSCDWGKFSAVYQNGKRRPNVFLYVGRLIPRKGISDLVQAYEIYTRKAQNPWELWIVGTGELENEIRNNKGVQFLGFVQPEKLPELMAKAGCFILPSRIEPWGVALHEATAAGLPAIVSDNCGAGDHLLKSGINGYIFKTADVEDMCSKMIQMSELSTQQLENFSKISFELSKQYTPEKWASTLLPYLKK